MKEYKKPELEEVCEIKAETVFAAQSWNPGQGNTDHNGTGNNGENGNSHTYNDGQGTEDKKNEDKTSGNNGKHKGQNKE